MPCRSSQHPRLDRRSFLTASGLGFAGLSLPDVLAGAQADSSRARSTILIWLDGGPSHIDTWDMKPQAAAEFRGPFQPIQTSAPGIQLCEHLPRLARQTHHLAIVHSMGHATSRDLPGPNNHSSGFFHGLTAHPPDSSFFQLSESRPSRPDDPPFIGAVVAAKTRQRNSVPQQVMLPRRFRVLSNTPGQYANQLGAEFNPLYVDGSNDIPPKFTVPALKLPADLSAGRLRTRQQLLRQFDDQHRRFERSLVTQDYSKHQQRAFSVLFSKKSREAFEIEREPEALRRTYGRGVNAMSLLMARRLVQAEVPFITVVWKKEDPVLHKKKFCNGAGSWDTHGKNFDCLRDILLPNFDRMFAALLDDLHQQGLLDETLVVVSSEMGRTPKIGDPRPGGTSGRNHWRQCMSVLMAGAGIRGGQLYGASDPIAAYPVDKPVGPSDLARTIYHAMGVHDLTAVDGDGQSIELLEEGRVMAGLF